MLTLNIGLYFDYGKFSEKLIEVGIFNYILRKMKR